MSMDGRADQPGGAGADPAGGARDGDARRRRQRGAQPDRAGAAVAFVSVVGDDQAGSDLTGLIGGQPGVEPGCWSRAVGRRRSRRASSATASSCCGPTRRDGADQRQAGRADAADRRRHAGGDLGRGPVRLRQGRAARRHSRAQLIAAAQQAGRRVVVDPKGPDFAAMPGPTWSRRTGASWRRPRACRSDNEAAWSRRRRWLRERHGFGAVLVTRAEDGMTLVDARAPHHFPAEAARCSTCRARATRWWRRWRPGWRPGSS